MTENALGFGDDELHLQQFKAQLRDRIERIERGEGIIVQRSEMRGFLDQIMAKVDRQLEAERDQL